MCIDFGHFEASNHGSKVMLPDTVSTAAVISMSSSSSESILMAPVPYQVRLTAGKDMKGVGLESGKLPRHNVRKDPGSRKGKKWLTKISQGLILEMAQVKAHLE